MYCSSCGGAVAKDLSYCNHVGKKLKRGDGESSEVRPDWLVFMMVATFILGLVVITILMGVMKSVLELPVDQILHLMALPFALMLIIEGVLIRLLLRRKGNAQEQKTLSNAQVTNELDDARQRLLSQAAASVTEHTTRAFEPIPVERKQK